MKEKNDFMWVMHCIRCKKGLGISKGKNLEGKRLYCFRCMRKIKKEEEKNDI